MKKKTGSNILFAMAVLLLVAALGILFFIHKTKQSSVKRMQEEAAKTEAPIELVARGTTESVVEEAVVSSGENVVIEESIAAGPEVLENAAIEGGSVAEEPSPTPYEEPLLEENTPSVEVGVEVESY